MWGTAAIRIWCMQTMWSLSVLLLRCILWATLIVFAASGLLVRCFTRAFTMATAAIRRKPLVPTAPVDVLDRYTALCDIREFRQLMGSLKQDVDTETIYPKESGAALWKIIEVEGLGPFQRTRRAVIAFLNAILFAGTWSFPDSWWWEMRTRLRKVLVISAVLEGENLRQILGGTPRLTGIPQAIPCISSHIEKLEASGKFDEMTKEYVKLFDEKGCLGSIAHLYLKDE